ncbi:MAG: hypothetical protein PHQ59_03605 [Candidatus Daviesbacteria bacterium]|nr:hypothetical protein [Candidatus Daviesbacteria bacterium]
MDDFFTKSLFPTSLFAYSTFKSRGSPVTWLKINSDLTADKISELIRNKVDALCRSLAYKLKKSRKVRFHESINGLDIYLITKPAGANVVRAEGHNQEIQTASFSILVFDSINLRIGYISGFKKEIGDAHGFIKGKILPDQVYASRSDVEYAGKKLLEDLLIINSEKSSLQLSAMGLISANLPESPSVKISSNEEHTIDAAVANIKSLWVDRDISDMRSIDYRIAGQNISIYPFGDKWKRFSLNVDSKGKSNFIESQLLEELIKILGVNIKETWFITQNLTVDFIVDKLLRDKMVSTDPPIPEKAEKVLIDLIKQELFKKPKEIAKRRCESWTCRTTSWIDWPCPKCGRPMIVIGEYITVQVNETQCLEQLASILESNFGNYEIQKQLIQRKKYKKNVIRIHNRTKNIAMYVVTVINQRDLNFCRSLASEGYGLIALIDPEMVNKKDELENLGADCLEISKIITQLKLTTDGSTSTIKDIFDTAFTVQENKMLTRINQRLVASENSLKIKSNYDAEIFEVDLKNILQALVPNVVRLGTKFKGKKVPDGYCSFKLSDTGIQRIFGWDAKFSMLGNYSLTNRDLTKQLGYIDWLKSTHEPKSLGSLRIYAIISNFNSINGFAKVMTAIKRSSKKPRLCRIVLIEDLLIVNLATWMLSNWQKVLDKGPQISQTFFNWIISSDRSHRNKWSYSTAQDWTDLESKLNAL